MSSVLMLMNDFLLILEDRQVSLADCCEALGVSALEKLTSEEYEKRYTLYANMIQGTLAWT